MRVPGMVDKSSSIMTAAVSTYLTDVHHFPGEKTLWYCRPARLASPTSSRMFDEAGMLVADRHNVT